MTYSQRFENLLANKNLSDYDRGVIESFVKQHSKRKSLSSKQSSYLASIEEKYAKAIVGKAKGCTLIAGRLEKLSKVVEPNSWAAGFVESLAKQNHSGRNLSAKQMSILEKIESENTDAARHARAEWLNSYDSYHRELAKVCAEHYIKTQYYQDLSKKILANPDTFIPTKKQWNSLTQNKYARKIIKIHESKPKFGKDSVVELRKTSAQYKRSRTLRGRPGFIIESDFESAAPINGGRWYKVLFAGEVQPVNLMEKDIKQAKL